MASVAAARRLRRRPRNEVPETGPEDDDEDEDDDGGEPRWGKTDLITTLPFPLSLIAGFPMLARQWLSGWFPMNWRGPTWRWR